MSILNSYAHAEDIPNHTREFLRRVLPFSREEAPEGSGGLEVSDVATRQLAMTAGIIWHGYNEYSISAIAAGTSFDTHYKKAGGGFVSSIATQWENTLYDDASGTLQAMNAGRYGTRWIYLDVGANSAFPGPYNAQMDMVYGSSNATSVALAQAEAAPTIPDHLTYHGRLIGRIIFQKSATGASVVESAWTNRFAASAVGDHALLSNLNSTDYTHLTAANHTDLTDGGATTLHTHDVEFPESALLFFSDWRIVAGSFTNLTNLYGSIWYSTYISNETTAADGDAMEKKLYLAAGTYDFALFFRRGSSSPIVDFYMDGVAFATGKDLYGGAVNASHTGTVVIAAGGLHTIKIVANGKNASSTGYRWIISYITLVKQ
jgi:hypothetical protein